MDHYGPKPSLSPSDRITQEGGTGKGKKKQAPNEDGQPRKRQRISLSCVPCVARKTKVSSTVGAGRSQAARTSFGRVTGGCTDKQEAWMIEPIECQNKFYPSVELVDICQ